MVGHALSPSHAPLGTWNDRYDAVYDLDFTSLRKPGCYRLVVGGDVEARSPYFRIAGSGASYGTLLRNGVLFDQMQRDGADVIPRALNRKPAPSNEYGPSTGAAAASSTTSARGRRPSRRST